MQGRKNEGVSVLGRRPAKKKPPQPWAVIQRGGGRGRPRILASAETQDEAATIAGQLAQKVLGVLAVVSRPARDYRCPKCGRTCTANAPAPNCCERSMVSLTRAARVA